MKPFYGRKIDFWKVYVMGPNVWDFNYCWALVVFCLANDFLYNCRTLYRLCTFHIVFVGLICGLINGSIWIASLAQKKNKTNYGVKLLIPIKIVIQVNLCQKVFFFQNMGRTCCVQKLLWMSETIFVHNMFSQVWAWNFHVLNL